jgi:hypothetical protein
MLKMLEFNFNDYQKFIVTVFEILAVSFDNAVYSRDAALSDLRKIMEYGELPSDLITILDPMNARINEALNRIIKDLGVVTNALEKVRLQVSVYS